MSLVSALANPAEYTAGFFYFPQSEFHMANKLKKLSDKEMRDAIREAYRKFGQAHHHDGIISWVSKTYQCEPPSWQKVRGIKSRIWPEEWRGWEAERTRIIESLKPSGYDEALKGFTKTTEEDGDEIVETYTPKPNEGPEWAKQPAEEATPDQWDKDLVKQDTEIVAVLNLCVDWDKFHRFMTLSDMHRLNLIGQEQLGFDRNRIRFALIGPNGELRECSLS